MRAGHASAGNEGQGMQQGQGMEVTLAASRAMLRRRDQSNC